MFPHSRGGPVSKSNSRDSSGTYVARLRNKIPIYGGFRRMRRLEPSTFCMAKGSAALTVHDAADAIRTVERIGAPGGARSGRVAPQDLTSDLTGKVWPKRGRHRPAAGEALTGAGASPTGPVRLSTATLEELDALPGVGPVTTELRLPLAALVSDSTLA